jgi:hypothetical protein
MLDFGTKKTQDQPAPANAGTKQLGSTAIMIERRKVLVGLMAGVAALTATATPSNASVSTAEAQAAIDSFIDALFNGDPARIEAVLAPELQVLRGDGKSHDKVGYLQSIPKYKFRPRTTDLKVTNHAGSLVVSYMIESDQTIDNEPVARLAPRLTVFRKEGNKWLVVAHSNFAHVGK